MASSHQYSSSADLYPPIRHQYDPITYPDPSANPSVDHFDASSSHNNLHQMSGTGYASPGHAPGDSTAYLGGPGAASHRAPYGEKYSDADDGPPEAMLASHSGNGSRGYRDASNAGAKSSFFQRKKKWVIAIILLLLAIIIAAVVGGVVASRNSSSSPSSSNNQGIGSGANGGKGSGSNSKDAIENSALTGGNGTTITMENGNTFTYINNFGGNWVSTPFDDTARPQSWSPRLNETWDYTNMKMYGVNLGGWLVTEPFIVPGLYEPFENDTTQAVDEYTLCEKYGDNATARMKEHYDTFITEEDFALIAGAGLNWIRLPFGFWAIETIEGEPFVEGLSWQYVLKAFTWARKYGLRINLDMHSLPGSQNGWNHSGKLGTVGFLNGTMGIVNAQRSLNYIRTVTEFISQPEYRNLVPMFSFINEPAVGTIGNETMREFYLEAYNIIREITGVGEGNGAWVGFHDGFQGLPTWAGFMSGADRISMDQHNYLGFSTPSNDSIGYQATKPCAYWASNYNNSMQAFGLSYSGEWSQAVNDCGVYLNNVGNGARFDGTYIAPGSTTPTFEAVGDCTTWNDWTTWDEDRKLGLQQVAYAHMDATQNWFFWTWRIGTSIKTGFAPNPMWHMKLALQEGWFPTDPRNNVGSCNRILAEQGVAALPTTAIFSAYPSPWMTGGAGAGTIAADQLASYSQWPPTSIREPIGTQATLLPNYTPTGTPITLSASTPTAYPSGASTVRQGNGWADATDTAGWYVTKPGCSYVAPYDGVYAAVPTAAC